MPAEIFGPDYLFLPKGETLDFDEISRLGQLFVQCGVQKFRLTGGEPLLRDGLPDLVGMLAKIEGLRDLALTTNGLLLGKMAIPLRDAGLRRVTVSLDALSGETAMQLNGGSESTSKTLAGIEVAQDAGLAVKINAVIMRGINEQEILPLAKRFRGSGVTLRFIEYMDVGTLNDWKLEQVVSANEIVELIRQKFPAEPVGSTYPGEVAKRYHYKDGQGEFGVISSVSQPFCGDCSRMRLSSEGKVVTCLFAESGTDLRKGLRNGSTDDEIKDTIIGIWGRREDRYSEERSEETVKRKKVEMYHIGG